MIVAIIRVVVAVGSGNGVDSTWLYTWGPIEQAVGLVSPLSYRLFQWANLSCSRTAIIIACLVSYKAWFSKDSLLRQRYNNGVSSQYPFGFGRSTYATKDSTSHDTTAEGGGGAKSSFSSLGTEAVPLDTIHVRSEYKIVG